MPSQPPATLHPRVRQHWSTNAFLHWRALSDPLLGRDQVAKHAALARPVVAYSDEQRLGKVPSPSADTIEMPGAF